MTLLRLLLSRALPNDKWEGPLVPTEQTEQWGAAAYQNSRQFASQPYSNIDTAARVQWGQARLRKRFRRASGYKLIVMR